jgi:hypothetical protein
MEELRAAAGVGITDDNVSESAPYVRALIVRRLEQLWRACDPHIQVQVNEDTGLIMRPDPRFVEAGIRIIDRLSDLYRIKIIHGSGSRDVQGSRDEIVAAATLQLEQMEARLKDTDE